MKLIKMLGIAMVLAMASMAFVGSGSASALIGKECWLPPEIIENRRTCILDEEKKSSSLKEGVQKGENIGNAVFSTPAGSITCTGTEFEAEGEQVGEGEETELEGEVTLLKFSGCTDNMAICTVSSTIEATTPFPIELGDNGEEEGSPEGSMVLVEPETPISLGLCGTCTYGGNAEEEVEGLWFNAPSESEEPSEVKFTEAVMKKSGGGFLCPSSASKTATQTQKVSKGKTQSGEPLQVEQTRIWLARAQVLE